MQHAPDPENKWDRGVRDHVLLFWQMLITNEIFIKPSKKGGKN